MSKLKGAPPPGWRPTVKGQAGPSGDVLTTAAQGGSVNLPGGGGYPSRLTAGYPGKGGSKGSAGQPAARQSGDSGLGSELRDLLGGDDLPDYGSWGAVAPGQRVSASRAGATGSSYVRRAEAPAPADATATKKTATKDFSSLFDDLDEPKETKADTGKPGSHKTALPEHYPTGQGAPDYGNLFQRLSQGADVRSGPAVSAAQADGANGRAAGIRQPGSTSSELEPQGLFKQTNVVPEGQLSGQPGFMQHSLPRATLAGGGPVKRGKKLVLDLDSFLVDCAVDWGKERAIRSFNLGGKADEGAQKWSDTMQSRGELTADDFHPHGVELDLSDTAVIGSDYRQLEKFAGALKMDRTVTTLRLCRAQLGNSGCGWLAGGMMKNRTLRELVLSDNGISDEGLDGLAAVLDTNTTLTMLDLGSNQVTSQGAALLADGLKRNRKLRELNLSYNEVDDAGARALADAVDPGENTMSVLRTLNLEGNPITRTGVERLSECLNTKGTMLETVYAADEVLSTKKDGPEGRRREPEKFVVICSETGVDIRATGRHKEQVTWQQEDEDIEVTFKEGWLQKRDTKNVKVDFSEQRVRIEIKNIPLMDAQLYGQIRPRDCMWTLGDGILQVILAKADKSHWPSLTKS